MGQPFIIGPNGEKWKLVAAKKPGPKGGTKTISELYGSALHKVKATKTETYRESFTGHWKSLKPYFGDLRPDDLDLEYVQGYVNVREKLKRKAQTIELELRSLKRIVQVANQAWEVPKVVLRNSAKPTNLKYYLEDLLPVIESVEGISKRNGKTYRLIGLFSLLTGMRLKDICNLTESKLDRKNWTITFRQAKIQNMLWSRGCNRMIPMTVIPVSESLKEILREIPRRLDPDAKLFEVPSRAAVAVAFQRAFKRCKLEGSFHTFRHIAATTMLRDGTNVNVVKEVLGHSNLETTMKYLHATADEKRDAVNGIRYQKGNN